MYFTGPRSHVASHVHTWFGAVAMSSGRVYFRPELVASLTDFLFRGQDPVHRAGMAEVLVLVEQGGVDGRGRLVDEAVAVQHLEHLRSHGVGESA